MDKLLQQALTEIEGLINTPLDVLDIKKPVDVDYARHLFKVLSKLSPLMGNMIEFFIPSVLNKKHWDIDAHTHYHNPPDYLVIEPFDTTTRTLNLQQTNTNGYKFQGDESQFERAQRIVESWGIDGKQYSPNIDYQLKLADLQSQFPYRLDTNFAKIDRIQHTGLEIFKKRVMSASRMGYTLAEWAHKNIGNDEALIKKLLE